MQITLQRNFVNNGDNRIWCIFVACNVDVGNALYMIFTIDVHLKGNLMGIS